MKNQGKESLCHLYLWLSGPGLEVFPWSCVLVSFPPNSQLQFSLLLRLSFLKFYCFTTSFWEEKVRDTYSNKTCILTFRPSTFWLLTLESFLKINLCLSLTVNLCQNRSAVPFPNVSSRSYPSLLVINKNDGSILHRHNWYTPLIVPSRSMDRKEGKGFLTELKKESRWTGTKGLPFPAFGEWNQQQSSQWLSRYFASLFSFMGDRSFNNLLSLSRGKVTVSCQRHSFYDLSRLVLSIVSFISELRYCCFSRNSDTKFSSFLSIKFCSADSFIHSFQRCEGKNERKSELKGRLRADYKLGYREMYFTNGRLYIDCS